jgi:hypothetical protein
MDLFIYRHSVQCCMGVRAIAGEILIALLPIMLVRETVNDLFTAPRPGCEPRIFSALYAHIFYYSNAPCRHNIANAWDS